MKIKNNGKEIPIRDSITKIIPQGKNNPISVVPYVNTENERSIKLSFKDTYLFDNILSDTLNIEKNNEKISINTKDSESSGNVTQYTGGQGINIDDKGSISIDHKDFVRYKTINSDNIKWSYTEKYLKADLTDDTKELINNSKNIIIFEPTSHYIWNTNDYIEKVNNNFSENIVTLLKFNNTVFYPCTFKSDMVIGATFTYYSSNVSTIYVVCVKDNDMKFYATKPDFQSIGNPKKSLL